MLLHLIQEQAKELRMFPIRLSGCCFSNSTQLCMKSIILKIQKTWQKIALSIPIRIKLWIYCHGLKVDLIDNPECSVIPIQLRWGIWEGKKIIFEIHTESYVSIPLQTTFAYVITRPYWQTVKQEPKKCHQEPKRKIK